ncbi:hypothetical protein GCM10027589_53730 [Actinocorallia lasiicapitis]
MRADFDRVYSPPEPPSSRNRRTRAVLLAVLGLGLAGGAAVAVPMLTGGDDPAAPPVSRPEPTTFGSTPDGSGPASSGPAKEPGPAAEPAAPGGAVEQLPKICGTIAKATFLKWVPRGSAEEFGGAMGGSCGYSTPAGSPFRYLRLETRIGSSRDDIDPISTAQWAFGVDLENQQKDTSARTLVVEARPGLGEEAFQRFSVNKGDPTVTARVEARIRNVIVTVTYSRDYSGKPENQQKPALDAAASVVEEALETYR